jgi:hypothetical protein
MRQMQEVPSRSASGVSLVLLVVMCYWDFIWRDVERRYTSSILTLP